MNPNIVPWTDAEIAKARELYHDNEISARRAAEIINKQFHRGFSVRTKNSIIGKANRLGWSTTVLSQYRARQPRLSVRQNKGMARPPREPQVPQIAQTPQDANGRKWSEMGRNPLSDLSALPSQPYLEERVTSIFRLRNRHCRYIIKGEGMAAVYCGAQTLPGSSWCEGCRKIVYRSFPQEVSEGLNPQPKGAQNNGPSRFASAEPGDDSAFPSKPLP